MATTYSFKGTADFSQHDAAVKKAGQEVDKYKEKVKNANAETSKLGKNNSFNSAYRSQAKLNNAVRNTTNVMNGASKGITGMLGKVGIYGAAAVAAFALVSKAIDEVSRVNEDFADKVGRAQSQIKGGWDEFLNRLSRWDWSNFLSGMKSAVYYAGKLYDLKDQQDTYKMFYDADLQRVNNDITELRIQKLELENQIAQKRKTQGKNVDVSSEQSRITDIQRQIDDKIKELDRIHNHAIQQAHDIAQVVAKSVVQMTSSQADEFLMTLTMAFKDRHKGSQANLEKGVLGWIFELVKRTQDDPELTGPEATLKKAMESGSYSDYKDWVKYMGKFYADAQDFTLTESQWGDFLKYIAGVQSKITESQDGKLAEYTRQLTTAQQARAAKLAARQQKATDQRKDDKFTLPTGPTYSKEMLGWYEKEIGKLNEKLKKTTNYSAYQAIQAIIEGYERDIAKIKFGEGNIAFMENRMEELRKKIDEISHEAVDESGRNLRDQFVSEYYMLAHQLNETKFPNGSQQWLEATIATFKLQLEDAFDAGTKKNIQQIMDYYIHQLNHVKNAGDRIQFLHDEIEQFTQELQRSGIQGNDHAVDAISKYSHELNDLQNKRGSINWIQQEISLTTSELNATNSPERIAELSEKLKTLNIQLSQLQKLSEINIVVKSKLDLDEEKLNRYSDAANSVASSLHSVGNMFTYLAEAQQGNRDWDELSEEEQKEIERLQNWGAALDALTDTLSSVYEVYRVWQDAQNQMARAAEVVTIQQENAALAEQNMLKSTNASLTNTIAGATVEETAARMTNASAAVGEETATAAGVAAMQLENAALVEQNMLKSTNATLAGTTAGAEAEETAARMTNTAAATTEGVAAGAVTSTKMGEAVASGTAQAAKLKFPFNIAAIAAVMASLASVISLVATLNKFESGGIVGGNSYYGDRQIARVNAGEMILNRKQQANLFNLINGTGHVGGGIGGEVSFRISGTDLVGVLGNHNRRMGRIS